MKKEREISELLELMLDHQEYFNNGLCIWINNIQWHHYITWRESRKLRKYIKENRPKNIYWLIRYGYYWKSGDINPRIKWINKHIKKLKK